MTRPAIKSKWLDRALIVGPYLTLATSEAEYLTALKHLGLPKVAEWISSEQANATAHTMEHPESGLCCIVCIRLKPGVTGIQVAAMLVHEAVHVWQNYCGYIGEKEPSAEFEAYSIQTIFQRLMEAYAEKL